MSVYFYCFVIFIDYRQPGMVGQKQIAVFSHVETTRGVGEVNLPVGEFQRSLNIDCCMNIVRVKKKVLFIALSC